MQRSVTLVQRLNQINITQGPGITIQQKAVAVTVYAEQILMTKFKKFTFTATEGQTAFSLETTPISMIAVFINGTSQNEEADDFSVSGKVLTLNEGVNSGDKVFGVYQEAATI